MSVVTDRRIPDSPVDQRLPLTQLLLVGFQHVLLMYGGAVAVPLIVGQAAGLSREEIAFLINADLLVAGIATRPGGRPLARGNCLPDQRRPAGRRHRHP
ncbi:solute carrier family 23 protein, partial [Pseudomonas aeruginosa]|uniref:solute carrier family 23 protein n=1 Tax=Pseudomonas aeruginosa TaxID=287 RepID=UPI0024432FF1